MEKILYTFEFKVGDQILAYYQGLLYKAIITKRKISDYGEIEYYIHYKGFKRSWDEWVDSDEVLAINEINLAHKERLEFNRLSCKKSRKRRKNKKKSASKSANKKRGRPKKSADQTAGPASVQLKELTVKLIDILKFPGPYTTQFTKQATAHSTNLTVEKTDELDLHVISEPAAVTPKRKKISQEPWKKDNASSPKPKKRKRGGRPKKNAEKTSGQDSAKIAVPTKIQLAELAIEKCAESVLLGCEKPATTPSPLLASEKSTELTAKESKSPGGSWSLANEKVVARHNFLLASEKSTKLTAEESNVPEQDAEQDTAKITVPTKEQLEEQAKVYERLALHASEKSTELTAEESDFPSLEESDSAQLAEVTVDKSAKSAIQSVTESATAQLASQVLTQLSEPTTSQFVEQAVDKSIELNLETCGYLATTQLAGPFSTPLPELFVEESDFPILAESDSAQLAELTVDKSPKSAIQSVTEPATAQLASQVLAQLSEPTTSQFVEQAVDKSIELNLETCGYLATTQLAGPSSTPLPELFVEESDFPILAESDSAQLAELTVDKSPKSAIQSVTEPATAQLASQVLAQLSEPTTSQFVEQAVDKSIELNLETCEYLATTQLAGPSSTPLPELFVEESDFPILAESDSAQLAELTVDKSPKSAIQSVTEPATAQLASQVLAQLSEPTTSQFVEQAVDKSIELNLETCGYLATTQLAGPSLTPFPELVVEETDFQKCGDPLFCNTEPAVRSNRVKNSQEPWTTEDSSSLKPAKKKQATTQFVKPDIQEFEERAVRSKQVKKSQEPWTTEDSSSLKPAKKKRATTQFVKPDIQKFEERAVRSKQVKKSQEPWTTEDSSSLKPAKKKRATTQFVKPDIQKFEERAVRSKRVKKSQEPWTTEDSSSLKPLKRNRCSPKKNVKKSAWPASSKFEEQAKSQYAETTIAQYVEPHITQCVEPGVEKSVESAIQSILELSAAQLAELTTSQSGESATSIVREFIAIEENEEDVRAVENIVINIVPLAKPYAFELFKKLKLPPVLRKAMAFDRMMHYSFQKVLKFRDDNFVAKIIYIFTNSSYFINDDEKKMSTTFSITLLQFFNNYVNDYLTYLPERKVCLEKKGLEYIQKRMKNQQSINYALKREINPKTIWCYLYGPMYLVRLIDALPKILLLNIWLPDYSIESFVDHIIELSRFLADNFCTYFDNNDYIKPESSE